MLNKLNEMISNIVRNPDNRVVWDIALKTVFFKEIVDELKDICHEFNSVPIQIVGNTFGWINPYFKPNAGVCLPEFMNFNGVSGIIAIKKMLRKHHLPTDKRTIARHAVLHEIGHYFDWLHTEDKDAWIENVERTQLQLITSQSNTMKKEYQYRQLPHEKIADEYAIAKLQQIYNQNPELKKSKGPALSIKQRIYLGIYYILDWSDPCIKFIEFCASKLGGKHHDLI